MIFSTQQMGKLRQEAEPGFKHEQSNPIPYVLPLWLKPVGEGVELTRFPSPHTHIEAISRYLWPSLTLGEQGGLASEVLFPYPPIQ